MTKLKKYWYVPLLIIFASYFIKDLFNNDDEILRVLQDGIKSRENTIEKLTKEKLKVKREFNKLAKEFKDHKKIIPPIKIKTITVEKIKYVTLTEYEKLYDFTDDLINKFSLSLKLEDKIITNTTGIIDSQKQIIKLKKKRKRWGLYFGLGYTQNKNFALNLSIGYRIL